MVARRGSPADADSLMNGQHAPSPTLFGGWEVCQGRPQGSPLLIHPALALTMTAEELLEQIRGHCKGGSGVAGGRDPCGRPCALRDASGPHDGILGLRLRLMPIVGNAADLIILSPVKRPL